MFSEIQYEKLIILFHLYEAYQQYLNQNVINYHFAYLISLRQIELDLDSYQKLISMYIARNKRLLQIVWKLKTPFKSHSLIREVAKSGYGFSTSRWNKKQLVDKLQKQIIDSQSKVVYVDNDSEAYFKKHHWKISYNEQQTLFKYSKEEQNHQIRVLTHVKYDPPNDPSVEKDQPPKGSIENEKLNYSQVAIYIKKKGAQKWLTAQMAVLQGSIQLLGVFFTTNQQPDFSWEKATYPGPQLKTLPLQVIDGINRVFDQFGLTSQLIMNMVIHSSSKVDQIDLEWLKKLKQIWA